MGGNASGCGIPIRQPSVRWGAAGAGMTGIFSGMGLLDWIPPVRRIGSSRGMTEMVG
jgi:hypothetical protein